MQSIRQFRSGIEQLCFYAREEVMGLFVMALGIASICAEVLVVLLILLFFGVTDEQGNRGIIRIVAVRLDTEGTDYAAYTDYDIYETESTKTAPEIIYQDTGYLPVGTVNFLDNVTVTDYAGKSSGYLKIANLEEASSNDLSANINTETGEITFPEAGIYEVTIRAQDDG